MKTQQLIIKGDPAPLAHCRSANMRVYDDRMHARNHFQISLEALLSGVTPAVKSGLNLAIDYFFGVSRLISQKNAQPLYGTYHTGEPNINDLSRFILLELEGKLYKSQGQIAKFSASKQYSQEPCIVITLRSL